MTMEGALTSMSETNLTTEAILLFLPYSERYVPASIPAGTPKAVASTVIVSVPRMAWAMPPPASPAGPETLVKKSKLRAAKPKVKTSFNIQKRKNIPKTADATDTPRAV
jgi:hypothetical protein